MALRLAGSFIKVEISMNLVTNLTWLAACLPALVHITQSGLSQLSFQAVIRASRPSWSEARKSKSMALTMEDAKIKARLSSSRDCIRSKAKKNSAGVPKTGR